MKRKKIYIVGEELCDYDYEGINTIAVYDTREKAEELAHTNKKWFVEEHPLNPSLDDFYGWYFKFNRESCISEIRYGSWYNDKNSLSVSYYKEISETPLSYTESLNMIISVPGHDKDKCLKIATKVFLEIKKRRDLWGDREKTNKLVQELYKNFIKSNHNKNSVIL